MNKQLLRLFGWQAFSLTLWLNVMFFINLVVEFVSEKKLKIFLSSFSCDLQSKKFSIQKFQNSYVRELPTFFVVRYLPVVDFARVSFVSISMQLATSILEKHQPFLSRLIMNRKAAIVCVSKLKSLPIGYVNCLLYFLTGRCLGWTVSDQIPPQNHVRPPWGGDGQWFAGGN